MKRDNWIVTKSSERPAGNKGECFYCNNKIGQEHKKDCVIRSRTVVVDFTVRMVVEMPECFNEYDIEFKFNESTWCANNLIQIMEHAQENSGSCLCNFVNASFFREATETDESSQGLSVTKLES